MKIASILWLVVVGLILLTGCGDDNRTAATGSTDSSNSTKPKKLDESKSDVATTPDKVDRFEGAGVSVTTPDGFTWKFSESVQNGDIGGSVYVCTTSNSTDALSLTIEERNRPDDSYRNAGAIGHFNGTMEAFEDTGGKIIRAEKPSLSKPIPDHVSFSVECQQATGELVFCYGESVFGRHTYLFQAFSTSQEEARRLISVAGTFTEN